MAFDVFISYSSKDKTIADAVCARLESDGIRCWIAPRDIVAGTSYGEAIIDAIHGARVMVLVFSSSANTSGHIPKEVERAVSNGVAILPFRIEDVAPGKSLDYFIGSVHWLDAMTPPMEKHLDDLATTVHKLLPASADDRPSIPAQPTILQHRIPEVSRTAPVAAPTAPARPVSTEVTSLASASNSKAIWIGIAAVVVLAAVIVGVMLGRGGANSPGPAQQPVATNPPAAADVTPDPAPAAKPSTPARKAASPSPAVNSGADPIVGCYQWFNNSPVEIRADGTVDRRSVHRALAPRERRTTRVHFHLARDGRNPHRLAGPTLHERR